MFAHQVIEDLKKQNYDSISKEWEVARIVVVEYLKKSISFHIEDVMGVMWAFKPDNKMMFENKKYMKAPYKITWIDFYTEDGKRGILFIDGEIYGDNNRHRVFTFENINNGIKGVWMMHPLYGILDEEYTPTNGIEYNLLLNKDGERLGGHVFHCEEFIHTYVRAYWLILENYQMLMQCKNVTTENHKPSEALNMARRKRGKQELLTYKTLKLLLPGKKEKHLLQNNPTGDHNRIHFCRGHFKEYTAEAPLFGRITGLWWWQPHVRGKSTDGVVMKDYQVEVAP